VRTRCVSPPAAVRAVTSTWNGVCAAISPSNGPFFTGPVVVVTGLPEASVQKVTLYPLAPTVLIVFGAGPH
jgi:hypothetical protein